MGKVLALLGVMASGCGARTPLGEVPEEEPGLCEPALDVPVGSCGIGVSDELPLCVDDVGPCVRDADCDLVYFDPCCHSQRVAVLTARAEAIQEEIGSCDRPPEEVNCVACVVTGESQCVDGLCEVVDCYYDLGC